MSILIPDGSALASPQSLAEYTSGSKTGAKHQALVICDSSGNPVGVSNSALQTMVPDASTTGTITANSGTAQYVQMPLTGQATAMVLMTGTYNANMFFWGSVDGGTTWQQLYFQVPDSGAFGFGQGGNGTYRVNVAGCNYFRVIATPWTSGTVNVTIRATQEAGTVQLGSPLPPGSNSIGGITDSGGSLTVDAPSTTPIYQHAQEEVAFIVTTGISALAASAVHLVLQNTSSTALVKLQAVIAQPVDTVVTGVISSIFTLSKRTGQTTAASGTGGLTPVANDSNDSLPANVTAWNKPGTASAGGTLSSLINFMSQQDEIKLTTLDAPTQQSLLDGGGIKVYDASWGSQHVKPITLRQNQTVEVSQGSTAGTGNIRLVAIFTTV